MLEGVFQRQIKKELPGILIANSVESPSQIEQVTYEEMLTFAKDIKKFQ
jgi:hypothetical protein